MQLDFRILLVILILTFFLFYILSYFSVITILIAVCLSSLFFIIFGWSTGERCGTKQKLSEKLEVSLSRKGKKKSLSPNSRSRSTYNKYTHRLSTDENMHRNGFSNSSFNDKKFDRSFDKWRSPVNSPGVRSPGVRVASPVAGLGLRTRKPSQLVSRRHSFSVTGSLDTSTNESSSRIPFLPTIKRALGLETIVSPRYTSKDGFSSYTSYPEAASPGFVPAVRLSQHDRHPLSKVRSSAVRSPNTIKIAPPDPHKLGSPRMLEKRRKDPVTDDTRKTPDMQSVLTALKEKRRKRTAGPSEEDTYCNEVPAQKSKRRRQESQQSNASTSSLPPLPASLPDLSETIPRLETPSLKRAAAPEVSEWEGRGSTAKRLRQEGRYNSISSSLSSSRYLERSNRSYSPRPDWSQESTAKLKRAIQSAINKITQEMPSDLVTRLRLQCEGVQKDQGGKENLDVPVSSTAQDPDSSLSSLQKADTVMLKPSLDKEDQSFNVSTSENSLLDQSQNKVMTPRQKVTLNKSFSVRKRQMSLYTGLNKSFSKVPKSNVVACIEDYEADREAEQRRVEQMLEDIVTNEDADKNKVKGSILGVTSTAVSTVVNSQTSASSSSPNTAPVTSSVSLPSLSVKPLEVSKSIATLTSTPATVSTTQGLGSSTALPVSISTSVSTLAPGLLATPVSMLGSGTTTSAASTNSSVAPTLSNNLFAGLPSSITPTLPGTNVAAVSSSKVTQSSAGGFSVGNVDVSIKTATSTSSETNSTSSIKFGIEAAEPGTVGAAVASAVAAACSSKAPNMLNFGVATQSTNATAIPNFGTGTNAVSNAAQPLFGAVNSVSATTGPPSFGGINSVTTTAGPPSFGGINSVVTSNVAPKVTAIGNTASTSVFSNTSTVNTTEFSFGAVTNVTKAGGSAPVLGNTTQSVPTAGFGTSSGPSQTFGANNFQNTTATTFGIGAQTNQPKFTPVFPNPNPTTQANTFGAPSGNPPAFSSAASTFGTPQNKQTFGNTTSQVTKATTTGGFNFGGGAAATVNSTNIFGATTNTAVSTTGFPAAPQTTAPPAFNFGASNQTTTSASSFSFGNTSSQATSSSTFNFGASNPVTAAASTTFNFGSATNPKPQTTSTFDFRGATNESKTQTVAPAFNFGTSNPTTTASTFGFGATVSKASTFNFGAGATTNTVGTAPAFGGAKPPTSATPVFGGSTALSSGTFQGGMTKSGSAPAFGDTGPSFGGGPKPSNPFNTASSPAFGGNAPTAAPQAAYSGNAVFGFGATVQQPQKPSGNTAGFNFSTAAGGGGTSTFNFGANASSTSFGAGSPAPGFGQAPSTPGQGMFNVGASNSATKPRAMTKAKRRGTRR